VFACSAAGGEQVVVKLTPTPGEARLEAAALALWAHTGAAVLLIDADVSYGALLPSCGLWCTYLSVLCRARIGFWV
jgi:hypothetical protein